MTNFSFLLPEFPTLHSEAVRAEELAQSDPRSSCFYARRVLELAVTWLYRYEGSLKTPYQDHLSALIHEPTFQQLVGPALFAKAKLLKDLGNLAVHSTKPISTQDSVSAVRELFHLCFWLARNYARKARPADGLIFDPALLPQTTTLPTQTLAQLQALAEQAEQAREKDEQLAALRSGQALLDEELKQARAELAAARAAASAQPDTHDYSEAETRDYFIDLLLKEAGWPLTDERDREYPVSGMPNEQGQGFVDYVLWGADGKPLALVEAKRTRRDPRIGQQQALLYANCLEAQFGQRPVIFYTNGYDHWLWDDRMYPPREVQGFLKRDELELMLQRRETRQQLATGRIDKEIVERPYQIRAIRRIGESFEKDNLRKALVVMATGAGKTRTVIALCDLLQRCNWAKRILFLADRVALVKQACNAFKIHLPASSPVNLVTEKYTESRVYVSTYQTMMGLIDQTHAGQRRFGVGHFDLVIIDEAHRSVYQKYRAIFDYFDSLLVGLTATPKDEVDKNTYSLFDLESGVPTDVYSLEDAVRDGFLVPVKAVSTPLSIPTQGLTYDALSEEDKERWDALEWADDGSVPGQVDAPEVHNWFFSDDTADKGLEHLMTRGQKVAGGDRLGKTIIFAKNENHAQHLALRFNVNYPEYKGHFARVITFKEPYAQSLIDDFSKKDSNPHIAISVDMLDTGIDVPEVVNLVFFKQVRSKTKFWQMVGRGTRLCKNLFAPGEDKQFFYIFDYCNNLEYFSQNPPTTQGSVNFSLSKNLFLKRLELMQELEARTDQSEDEQALRAEVAERLHAEVAGMSLENFVVRPQRLLVEKYSAASAWQNLTREDYYEIGQSLAGLPSAVAEEDREELAKRFDLFMLRLELNLLQAEPGYNKQRKQLQSLAEALEEKANIPLVKEQLPLIEELQTDAWWDDVTVPMLDTARKKLRKLVKLIDPVRQQPVYTNFEDVLGEQKLIELPGLTAGVEFDKFKAKARQFLRAHEDHIAIHKLRHNLPLTATDLAELEKMLVEAGVGSAADVQRAKEESAGLGLFVRSLVGLDRGAAQQAFSGFIAAKRLSANQLEFVGLIVEHLTEHGTMKLEQLYSSPYTDISPRGPEGVFTEQDVDVMITLLDDVRQRAVA
jgi:type I restriction enzyme R subunit